MHEHKAESSSYFKGAIYGILAVSIWAGWMSITRAGVTTSLSTADVTMLRYTTAGFLLSYVLFKKGFGLDRIHLWQLAVIVCGAGAPYALVAANGLKLTKAAEAGVLIPGVMPLFVGLLSCLFFKETFTRLRLCGYACIIAGALAIIGEQALGDGFNLGHAYFLTAAFMWACYTIVFRQSKLEPLHTAALISVISAVVYLPIYWSSDTTNLFQAPVSDVLTQAIFQGVFATILSLFFYGRAVKILGASSGAVFGALVPVLAALIAIPVLHEIPSHTVWIGIFAASFGVYLASGGPLPLRKTQNA